MTPDYPPAHVHPRITAENVDDYRLIQAIGMVESGMNPFARNGSAFGAYQMRPRATADAARLLIAEGNSIKPTQRVFALAYLRVIRSHLAAIGHKHPTPEQLALCWNLGVTGACRAGMRANDYAERVGNLYRSTNK